MSTKIYSAWIVVSVTFVACDIRPSSAPTPAAALPLDQRIESVVQPLVDDGWAKGMIVGVLLNGEKSYFGFGGISDGKPIPPDEHTIFEIGSVTKVFTTITLAEMAARGEVSLKDPVKKFLRSDILIPAPQAKSMTLESLATHQSGLPSVPLNFWNEGDKIHDNDVGGKRWSEYSLAQLRDYFQDPSPPIEDAGKYLYSNLGVGLLGYALQEASGTPLEQLIVERVCRPLGMDSTGFSIELNTTGYDADGNPVAAWEKGQSILVGAFALRSTCEDLLKLAQACLEPENSPLKDALNSSLQSRGEINALEQTALGWKRNKYGAVYTLGATGGYRCAVFLHPQTKSAVVVIVNSQMGGVVGGRATLFDALAGNLLNVSLGAPSAELDFPSPADDKEFVVQDFVGAYRPENGDADPSFPIRAEGRELLVLGPGEVEMRLWPRGPDRFFLRSYLADIKFLRDESGLVTGADLEFEGNQARLKRFLE